MWAFVRGFSRLASCVQGSLLWWHLSGFVSVCCQTVFHSGVPRCVCPFICMWTFDCFHSRLLSIMLRRLYASVFCAHHVVSFVISPEVKWLARVVTVCLIGRRAVVLTSYTVPHSPAACDASGLQCPQWHRYGPSALSWPPGGCEVVAHCGLVWASPS